MKDLIKKSLVTFLIEAALSRPTSNYFLQKYSWYRFSHFQKIIGTKVTAIKLNQKAQCQLI